MFSWSLLATTKKDECAPLDQRIQHLQPGERVHPHVGGVVPLVLLLRAARGPLRDVEIGLVPLPLQRLRPLLAVAAAPLQLPQQLQLQQ